MRGLFRLLGTLAALGVILLQHPRECWAAETTERGISGTLYGGAGTLVVPNNETRSDEYQVWRFGAGFLGIWRPGEAKRADTETSGFFVALGGTFELESSLHSVCGFDCYGSNVAGERFLAKHFAGRLGFGYSFRMFEFRLGALYAAPDPKVDYAMEFAMPDLQVRIGERNVGWFELGLGAYSASTNLRPGLYLGGTVGSERFVQASIHGGIHFVNGLCCGTVTTAGYVGEVSVAHAFSSSLRGTVGVALLGGGDRVVAEGSTGLSYGF
ncbi:MAG TPA: hypothetical protein VER96_16585 [Polyangiaceae bacterium]|nr:hypothetical protein [Polyangiaceae bacterium]